MKKLQEAVENVKYGSVLTINKDKNGIKDDKYSSCITLYDGRILQDVKVVELGDFLSIVPNIACQLDQGCICQVIYLFEEKKYLSTIARCVREGGYKEPYKYTTVKNFEVLSDNFLDSIIELDTRIATNDYINKLLQKKAIA